MTHKSGTETFGATDSPGDAAATATAKSNGRSARKEADIDPRISYPSYKSFDEFIDVERLKSLDAYIIERIERHIAARSDMQFYTGPFRLENALPDRPGSRMIYLAQSKLPDSYFDLDRTELWQPTSATSEFALLMDFIATLPFKATGRMLIMYDDVQRPVPAHRDHTEQDLCHEFIWFRTNLRKPFFMLNHETGEKQYVESYSAWFDSVNQFHGTDPGEGITFSIRVDGIFSDEFRKRIPVPATNVASTPALWAATSAAAAVHK
ncbi:MAG TPA: hypothetical protein VGW12_14380 [Pyrinomonadaceae bacterium]|nr:hypothetical protein [Pyrinomonadaceae bacterium]